MSWKNYRNGWGLIKLVWILVKVNIWLHVIGENWIGFVGIYQIFQSKGSKRQNIWGLTSMKALTGKSSTKLSKTSLEGLSSLRKIKNIFPQRKTCHPITKALFESHPCYGDIASFQHQTIPNSSLICYAKLTNCWKAQKYWQIHFKYQWTFRTCIKPIISTKSYQYEH